MTTRQVSPMSQRMRHDCPRLVGFILILVAPLVLSLASASLHAFAQDEVELTYEYLWNPSNTTLQDWQVLDRGAGTFPGSMIWGDPGEIFLVDTRRAHVLWFTREGELLQVIGSRGQGPGELLRPTAVAFDKEERLLWVADGTARYSRFSLNGREFEFLDSFTSALMSGGMRPNLVIDSEDQYWTTGRSVGSDFDPANSMGLGRIKLVNVAGRLLREFGPLWGVMEGSPWRVLEPGIRNSGFLTGLDRDRLAWVWMYRPIVEVWSGNGVLLAERMFAEVPVTPPKVTGKNSSIAPAVMQGAVFDQEGELLFVKLPGEKEVMIRFLGLDTVDLHDRESYVYKVPGLKRERVEALGGIETVSMDGVKMSPTVHLADRVDGTIRFYGIDMMTMTPVVLFPISSKP